MMNLRLSSQSARSLLSLPLAAVAAALIAAGTGSAGGAALSIRADIGDSEVTLGEQFAYQVVVEWQDGQGYPPFPILPEFPDALTPVSDAQTIQSSESSLIQGQFSRTFKSAATVLLSAAREGACTIPAPTVSVDGQVYSGNEIVITVVKPEVIGLPASLRDANILPARTQHENITSELNGHLFLLSSVSKKDPYEGEPFLLTYTVMCDHPKLADVIGQLLSPALMGVADEEFEIKELFNVVDSSGRLRAPRAGTVELEGRRFRGLQVYQAFCIPKRSGFLLLGPYHIDARIPVSGGRSAREWPFNDPFMSLFDSQAVVATLPSMPIEVDARPLPPPPPDFDNVIGDYTLSAAVDRNRMSEDELAKLTLTVQGLGHIHALAEPRLPASDDWMLHGCEKGETVWRSEQGMMSGRQDFNYVLRPQRPGRLNIPAVAYTVFSPASGQYQRLRTEPIAIDVEPSASGPLLVAEARPETPGDGAVPAPAAGVRNLGDSLAYIHTVGFSGAGLRTPLYLRPWVFWAQALPLLAVFVAFGVRRRRERMELNAAGMRRRGARGAAGRRLRRAARLEKAGAADALYAELSAALRGFFADKFGRPASGLTIDAIAAELESRGVEPGSVAAARALLERCDHARFAPASQEQQAMRAALDDAGDLINAVAKRI